VIIVEGPDGSGKTTLVNHLAEKYDIPISPKVVGSDTRPMIADLQQWVESNLKKGLQWMLFDRHRLISEPIYQMCMGRRAQEGFDDIKWFTARMIDWTRIRPFIVYCLPPHIMVHNNLIDDKYNVEVQQYLHQIYSGYVAAAAGDVARGQAVLFDYNSDAEFLRIDMLFELWVKNNRNRLGAKKLIS
jgi:energy-coupling factor transporter ATP-binding protein EcfA2